MDILDKFLQNNNLHNPEDMDSLLECASLTRELIGRKRYSHIIRVINYTVENSYYEAFLWITGLLQEEFVKEDCALEDFYCLIGGRISNYDEFVQSLQVDFNPLKNYIEKVYDKNGEPEAFFNVMIYKTNLRNVFLVSCENFDNKDNDYIQYKLSFVRDPGVYID